MFPLLTNLPSTNLLVPVTQHCGRRVQKYKITVSQNSTDFILALDISNQKSHIIHNISHIKAKPKGTLRLENAHSVSLIPFTPSTPPTKSSRIQHTAHSQRYLFSFLIISQYKKKKVKREQVDS